MTFPEKPVKPLCMPLHPQKVLHIPAMLILHLVADIPKTGADLHSHWCSGTTATLLVILHLQVATYHPHLAC